jgi:DNA-binding response OmpR family regulator
VSGSAEDHSILREITSGSRWKVHEATCCRDAIDQLERADRCIIFCARELEDGSWKDILDHLKLTAAPSMLVVTSSRADDDLWAEVLNLGGYEVLAKPFDAHEVKHLLVTAYLSRPESSRTLTATAAR